MLPRQHRLQGRTAHAETIRDGQRVKGRNVLFHVLLPRIDQKADQLRIDDLEPQVAFAVSRRVGGSVERHRVTRRLRHIASHHVDELPRGSKVVVRANPRARFASHSELVDDFRTLVKRVGS